jgi:hypothetical protein
MCTPSPWIDTSINFGILLATCAIAYVAQKYSKQQLAIQMATALLQAVTDIEQKLPENLRGGRPVTESIVDELMTKSEARHWCMLLLNHFETFCSAVQSGAVDTKLARRICGDALVQTYKRFQPFILRERQSETIPKSWSELITVVKKWE